MVESYRNCVPVEKDRLKRFEAVVGVVKRSILGYEGRKGDGMLEKSRA